MKTEEIQEISKIVLKPNECLLIRPRIDGLDHEEATSRFRYIAKIFREALPDGAKFVIAPIGHFDFQKVRIDEVEEKDSSWFDGGTIFSWK